MSQALSNKLTSVFTTALSTFAVATVTALSFSSPAQGLTFSGVLNATWGEPNSGNNPNPVFRGVGTSTFIWGQEDEDFGTPPNRLSFMESPFETLTNELFKIGDLEYFNGSVLYSIDEVVSDTTVKSVPLNLSLSLTNPLELNEVFGFNFELENTLNIGTPEENADSVIIVNNMSNRSFTFDGEKYTLELVGFSQDGGETNVNEFRVLEAESTTAALYGKISRVSPTQTVPEPITIAGLSLLGIYLLFRKKS
jgi:hypothetical protein